MEQQQIIMIVLGILVITSALTFLKDISRNFMPAILILGVLLIGMGFIPMDQVYEWLGNLSGIFVRFVDKVLELLNKIFPA